MATAHVQPLSLTSQWMWLRSKRYDMALLFGTLLLAFAAGAAVTVQPNLFAPILFADIILLGYHHVGSTFTRIAFDSESLGRYRAYLTWIPLAIAAVVGALAYTIGLWFIVTVYFYWQWFHYSRQSYGIAQAFYRKSGEQDTQSGWLRQATFYSVPVWGILARSAEGPTMFLGGRMRALPVPHIAVQVAGFAALCLVVGWVVRSARSLLRSPASTLYCAYMCSHFAMFYVAYLGMSSLEHGWLVVNIWHNAQYILFVWLFNSNRFRSGVDPQHTFLSWLSQRKNVLWYLSFCLVFSLIFYAFVNGFVRLLPLVVMPSAALMYQMINIHHYVVDGVVWKRKKDAKRLGATA